MSSERPVRRVTDPGALRALGHPIRLALLELLGEEGPLTATAAGERLGESPANTSFHLRSLAKHGFVEEAEGGHGRQRPWRAVPVSSQIDPEAEDATPEARLAAETVVDVIVERRRTRERTWRATRQQYPKRWRDAAVDTSTHIQVNPEELRELGDAVRELISRYQRDDRDEWPSGALPVWVSLTAFPVRPPADEEQW